jgi:hypothetical protein
VIEKILMEKNPDLTEDQIEHSILWDHDAERNE